MNDIKFDKDLYAVMANSLVTGKQDMTLREHKLIRLLITQVVPDDTAFNEYKCNLSELADFLEISRQAAYKDIHELCSKLISRVLEVECRKPNGKTGWSMFHFLSKAEYDGTGNLTLRLSDEIKEFVLQQKSLYLQYQYKEVLKLNSVYSVRLFEILLSDFNKAQYEKEYFEYTIPELRKMLCCEDKFEKISQFKQKVVESAINDINNSETCGYETHCKYIKDGRNVVAVRFYFSQKFDGALMHTEAVWNEMD